MSANKAVIFSAPSGSGKTTLVKHLLDQNLPLAFSISATSRSARPNEVHGKDYYFISQAEFDALVQDGAFVEWEEVYKGTCYGTLKSEVQRIWAGGKAVIFDVDVVGGLNLKRYFGSYAQAVFVKPPSIQALRQRLEARGTESPEKIQTRVDKAYTELKRDREFDHIILNDDLDKAKKEALTLVGTFLNT